MGRQEPQHYSICPIWNAGRRQFRYSMRFMAGGPRNGCLRRWDAAKDAENDAARETLLWFAHGASSTPLKTQSSQDAGLAQLVEQRFCKPKVTGSIPVTGTTLLLPPRPQKLKDLPDRRSRALRLAHIAVDFHPGVN